MENKTEPESNHVDVVETYRATGCFSDLASMTEPKCETIKCYLLNKHNAKTEFVLELHDDVIKVLSRSSRKVKTEIILATCHTREMPLQPKQEQEETKGSKQ